LAVAPLSAGFGRVHILVEECCRDGHLLTVSNKPAPVLELLRNVFPINLQFRISLRYVGNFAVGYRQNNFRVFFLPQLVGCRSDHLGAKDVFPELA
jgi:hypothetical protein